MSRAGLVFLATVVVALAVSLDGTLRLSRIEFHVLRFAVWGYPPWTAWAAAIGQIAGAALLLWPRTFPAGAGLLAVIAAGFVVTHLRSGDGPIILAPLGVLAALAGLALARRSLRA